MTIARNLSFLAEGVSSTGVLGATYGGTGQSSITTGDLLYGSASNTISKLAIGSTGTILRVVAGVPAWGTDYTGTVTSVAATVPSFLSISGSPITTSGTLAITYSGTALPTANGGTALTSFTANGVLYASSSSVLATSSSFVFDGTNLGVGGSALSSSAGRTDLTVNGSSSSIISWGVGGTRKSYLYQDGTDFNLFNEASGAIRLGAGGAERMRIFNSGGVSIGNTTDPGATNLSVTGTGKYGTTVSVGATTPATSGAGITFPATQSASTNANTLDDYEEGTWTPNFSTGWTTAPTVAYATYTKVGNLVSVFLFYYYGVSTAAATISGLPFASSSTCVATGVSYDSSPAQAQIGAIYIGVSSSTIGYYKAYAGSVSFMELSITYQAA